MSVRFIASGLVVLALTAAPRGVEGASITFTEEFIYPDADFPPGFPGQAFYIGTDPAAGLCDLSTFTCERSFATVLFDLTATVGTNPANLTELRSETVDAFTLTPVGPSSLIDTHAPDSDATGYVAGTPLASATLTLGIRGLDPDNDNVQFQAFVVDGNGVLHQNTYLGVLTPTSVVIPLDAALLAALSADGQLGIRATSFGTDLFTHDFNLLSARLDATTVPEPAMLLLFGTAAAAAARRRFTRSR